MNLTTSIMLRGFRYSLARHGRTISITSRERGGYNEGTGARAGDEASYGIDALLAPGSDTILPAGNAEVRIYSVLTEDLPLVGGVRQIPRRNWTITDDAAGQEILLAVTSVDAAIDGNVQRITAVRKK